MDSGVPSPAVATREAVRELDQLLKVMEDTRLDLTQQAHQLAFEEGVMTGIARTVQAVDQKRKVWKAQAYAEGRKSSGDQHAASSSRAKGKAGVPLVSVSGPEPGTDEETLTRLYLSAREEYARLYEFMGG